MYQRVKILFGSCACNYCNEVCMFVQTIIRTCTQIEIVILMCIQLERKRGELHGGRRGSYLAK